MGRKGDTEREKINRIGRQGKKETKVRGTEAEGIEEKGEEETRQTMKEGRKGRCTIKQRR